MSNGTLKRRIYRKPTWNGQYLNFNSWAPLSYKRNLVRTLSYRIYKLCSPDVIKQEIAILFNILGENGYPEKFIHKHSKIGDSKPRTPIAPKKQLHITLQFKSDAESAILNNRLQRVLKRTYFAADIRVKYTSLPMFNTSVKDKLPPSATSMCVYKFTCSCGSSYIGRTKRRLSSRIREHLPVWFIKGERRSPRSSILEHLLDTCHPVSTDCCFKVIYKIPSKYSVNIRFRLLCIAEALAIHTFKPDLCCQKRYTVSLSLPWT